jgi:hypothetical protein
MEQPSQNVGLCWTIINVEVSVRDLTRRNSHCRDEVDALVVKVETPVHTKKQKSESRQENERLEHKSIAPRSQASHRRVKEACGENVVIVNLILRSEKVYLKR